MVNTQRPDDSIDSADPDVEGHRVHTANDDDVEGHRVHTANGDD